MSIYDATISPAPTEELVAATATHLAADTTNIVVGTYIQDAAHVFAHAKDERVVCNRRLIVKELRFIGGRLSTLSMHDDAPIQVTAEIDAYLPDGREFANPQKWLAAMLRRVHKSIAGVKVTMPTATALLGYRLEFYPSGAFRDGDVWYSSVQYNATLNPVTL